MLMYLTIIDSKEGQQKFEFIYNRYKKLMFYIANKILGDTRDSEDTVHDAFLKIIEIIDDIKDVDGKQLRIDIQLVTEETDYEIILDTELVDSTKVDIAGNEAKLVVKGERSTLLWKDEPFILMVTGDMNSDELIQVAKGITVTTK